MKIWNVAIRQPVFMSMILLAGIVMGVFSYFRMPVDLYPNVEFPVVAVITVYPGAGPHEVEQQVTTALEDELITTNGIDTVSSTSSEGVSTIVMQFNLNVPVAQARQNVLDKVNKIRNQLPKDIQEPVIQTFDPNDQPIMSFSVADRSGKLTPLQLRQVVKDNVQTPLQQVPGVSAVDINGGDVREILVNLDMRALEARHIAPQQVVATLQAENINVPGGTVEGSDKELLVRTPAYFQTLDDIRNVIISQRSATPVYLRDVAQVVDGLQQRDTVTRLNGKESVVMDVRKQSATNTLAIADGVKKKMTQIEKTNPDLAIAITSDQSTQIQKSTDGAIEDLLWGALLAAAVMLFFFRDLRNTLVTIAGLPVIMIATLFFMNSFGIGLNQISLLALALVVGLVIDDGIVVRENILRWVEKGYSPRKAASLGTAEVVQPVLATGATILAVFLPVAYASGIIGKFFREFGLTVSIAIIVSTFEALTMAPMLSAYFFRSKHDDEETTPAADDDDLDTVEERFEQGGDETGSDSWLHRIYKAMLNWTLRHRLITALIAVVVMVGSVASVRFIEITFLPKFAQHEFSVSMSMPAGTPLDVTTRAAIQVEDIIRSHPAVGDVVATIGGAGTPEKASFTVLLKDQNSRSITAETVINELRGPLANVPGILFAVTGNAGPGGASSDVTIELVGTENGMDYNAMGAEAQKLSDEMAKIPGLVDINSSFKNGGPEMQLNVDRARAAQMGLSTAQIASTVRLLVNGDQVSTYRGQGTGTGSDVQINVQLQKNNRATVDDVLNIMLQTPSGQIGSVEFAGHGADSYRSRPDQAQGSPADYYDWRQCQRPYRTGGHQRCKCVDQFGQGAGRHADQVGRQLSIAAGCFGQSADGLGVGHRLYLYGAGQPVWQCRAAVPDHVGHAAGRDRGHFGLADCPSPFGYDGHYRLHHVDGFGGQELDFVGRFCQPPTQEGAQRARCHAYCRSGAVAAGADDLARHDLGHDPGGFGFERRR